MTAFTDFLADPTALRVVLVTLTATDGSYYVSDVGYLSGPSDDPANTYFEQRLTEDVEVERRVSGPFSLQGGAFNASEIVVGNPDGELDSWVFKTWKSATIEYGDKSWALSQFETRWTGRIVSVEQNDEHVRFTLGDRYEALRKPIQRVPQWFGQEIGQLRPLSYGYPKNVAPPVTGTSNPDYQVHEAGTVEDPVVARYVNQAPSTSPSVVTETRWRFELGAMPSGTLTCDTKGIRDSGGTWIETLGAALEHMLTRSVDILFGYALGGSDTTLVLDDDASDVDDAYNNLTIYCVSQDDPEPPWSSPENGQNIEDYDGDSHTITVLDWDGDVETRAEGDLYHIVLASESNHVGPLQASEVDGDAFDQYDTDTGNAQVGMWINREQTAVQVLDAVLHPGGFHAMTPAGKVTIGVLQDPDSGASALSLGANDLHGEIEVAAAQKPVYKMRVGYNRNYSPAGGGESYDTLTIERAQFVTNAYQYVSKEDLDIQDNDPDAREVTYNTVLTSLDDAQSELDRFWALFSEQRYVYTVPAGPTPMGADLGDVVDVTDARHQLSGKKLVLMGIRENLTRGLTELELWG